MISFSVDLFYRCFPPDDIFESYDNEGSFLSLSGLRFLNTIGLTAVGVIATTFAVLPIVFIMMAYCLIQGFWVKVLTSPANETPFARRIKITCIAGAVIMVIVIPGLFVYAWNPDLASLGIFISHQCFYIFLKIRCRVSVCPISFGHCWVGCRQCHRLLQIHRRRRRHKSLRTRS